MAPVRVLHVLGRLDTGGVESRLMDLLRAADPAKVRYDFVKHTPDIGSFEDEIRALGGSIFEVPRFTGKNLGAYARAWRDLLTRERFDVIHGHATSTAFVYLRVARHAGITMRIAHARSTNAHAGWVRRWSPRLAVRAATHRLAVSRLAGESEFGSAPFQVVPNAIVARTCRFNLDDRAAVRQELGLGDEPLVLHVGRFHEAKNHSFLLRVMADLRGHSPDAHLVIVGDGALREEIEAQIAELALSDAVHLVGMRSDVHRYLSAADVMCFPSLYEGLPGSLIEAQAAGLPIVAADTIADESFVLPTAVRRSLEAPIAEWTAAVVEALASTPDRSIGVDALAAAGFDAEALQRWYEDFYAEGGR